MTRLRSLALKLAVTVLIDLRQFTLLAHLFSAMAIERMPDGSGRRFRRGADKRPTLLALSANQYRGDPECLAADGTFRVLELTQYLQRKIVYRYYPAAALWPEIVNPRDREDLIESKRRLRQFLAKFLPKLYQVLGVRCIISPHIHYDTDIDWGPVSQSCGIPYVVLHRENLYASPGLIRGVHARFASLDTHFEGAHIVVHNETVRQVFIESGFVTPDRVSASGCMRMDQFARRIRQPRNPETVPKRVVLFPFAITPEDKEEGRRRRPVFDRVHVSLVRFALERPDVKVVMKPKAKWAGQWREQLTRALQPAGLSTEGIPNLIIRADLDAQDLIFSSAAVIGLNTTTLIEAGVAGCRAIIPYYRELQDPFFDDLIYFRDRFVDLITATSDDQLIEEIGNAVSGQTLPQSVEVAYRKLFEDYVSSLDGGATKAYVGTLKRICDETTGATTTE